MRGLKKLENERLSKAVPIEIVPRSKMKINLKNVKNVG